MLWRDKIYGFKKRNKDFWNFGNFWRFYHYFEVQKFFGAVIL